MWLKCFNPCVLNSATTALSTTGVTRGSLWVWRWRLVESTRSTRTRTGWFVPTTIVMSRDSSRSPITRGASASSMVASAGWCAFTTLCVFQLFLYEQYSSFCKLSSLSAFVCIRAPGGNHPQRHWARRELHRHHATTEEGSPDFWGFYDEPVGEVQRRREHHITGGVRGAEDHASAPGENLQFLKYADFRGWKSKNIWLFLGDGSLGAC